MEFLKKIFNDDDKIVGLCSLKKESPKSYNCYTHAFDATKLIYSTNTKINFLLS